jgi:hypothetical protein
MTQIFITCTCGMPNALGGLDPGLLGMLGLSGSKYFCTKCGEQLNNSDAFLGEWHILSGGNLEVHRKSK